MSKRLKLNHDSSDSDSDKSDDEGVGFKRKKRSAPASTSSSCGRREIVWDLGSSKDMKRRSGNVDSTSRKISSSSSIGRNPDILEINDKRSLDEDLSIEEEFRKRLQAGNTTTHVTSTSPSLVTSSSSTVDSGFNEFDESKDAPVSSDSIRSQNVQHSKFYEARVAIPTDSNKNKGIVNPTTSEIIAQMGFEKDKGLARYAKLMAANDMKMPTVKEIDERIKMLGLGDDEFRERYPGTIVEDECFETLASTSIIEEVEEEVSWIPPEVPNLLHLEEMRKWRTIGTLEQKRAYSRRCRGIFVNNDLFEQLSRCKKFFREWSVPFYNLVRCKANPFEKIGKGPFICRSAMKMANIDAMLGFALTEPKSHTLEPIVRGNELFYFADVCGGPGGFTEYILWRKKWEAKGFGMTLVGNMDFGLKDSTSAETHSFASYYGPAEDGNVYNPANVCGFIQYVLSNSDRLGVHLMMADGAFSVKQQENLQEILSAQIILSQCLIALAIVRPGGNFVCKIFDVFSPFTVGLMYLMYVSFDLVTIHKPNSSRPANSERYLICKLKREGTHVILEYLQECHKMLWDFSQSKKMEDKGLHIMDLVPLQLLSRMQHPFCHFIMSSNNYIARKQIRIIREMIKYAKNPELINEKQALIPKECFRIWNLPETIGPVKRISTDSCMELLSPYPKSILCRQETLVTTENINALFSSPYDWRVVVVEDQPYGDNRGFYLSTGGYLVYKWTSRNQMWILAVPHNDKRLELPAKTLVYGEMVKEISGSKSNQIITTTFHIIDALLLGGKDVRFAHYTQRHELCTKFVKAINKPDRDIIPVKVKNPVRMENVMDILDKLSHRVVKLGGDRSRLVCPIDHTDENSPVILPSGLQFIKITRDPWQMALNRQKMCKYWYNMLTGESTGNVPSDAVSDFFWTCSNRVLWHWDNDTNIVLTEVSCAADPRLKKLNQQKVHAISLINHVSQAIRTPPRQVNTQQSQPITGAETPSATAKSPD